MASHFVLASKIACVLEMFFFLLSFNYIFRSLKFLTILFWHENSANGEKKIILIGIEFEKIDRIRIKELLMALMQSK